MSERLLILAGVIFVAALAAAAINASVRRHHHIDRIDPDDIEGPADVVVFTSPYCHGCSQWLAALAEDSVATATIDIGKRPDAAARYRITSTPRVVVVDRGGVVVREFHHHAPRRSDLDRILSLTRN